MPVKSHSTLLSPAAVRYLGWGLYFVTLVIGSFNFPMMPSAGLDPSWRMALGYFHEHNMQFGKDVVFTYGPLGFIMGKTYSGVQFWSLIAGQLTLAIISATVFLRLGMRIKGYVRIIFIIFTLLFGVFYEDALHMLVIVILGFELLRPRKSPNYPFLALIGAVLAIYAQIKFTDLLLSLYIVLLYLGYGLWKRERGSALCLSASYFVVYLGIWVGFGQDLTNLPAYFHASWEISQGYQWAMGFPTPMSPFWKGLVVLGSLIVYTLLHLRINPDKPRAIANALLLGAFVYLNWKHGFVRADGHMIGFFFCALLPIVSYPHLLDDTERYAKIHRWAFIALTGLSVWGLESINLHVVSNSLANFQNRIWGNVSSLANWHQMRAGYRDQLGLARKAAMMPSTHHMTQDSTVDVLGSEQGVALFNKFNYRPRPVIQSYSTFTPMLAGLNRDFFASDAAPEYVLMKIQSIDHRLPTLDDAHVLRMLPHRYDYSHTENGFLVWHRKPGPFDAARFEPKPIISENVPVNHPFDLAKYNNEPLWLQINLQPTLLGKTRSFLYKPPQVMLRLTNSDGSPTDYLMPLPQGRTGFIINPIIEDYVDYMHFAGNSADKLIRSVEIIIDPVDEKFFSPTAEITVSSLPISSTGLDFFPPSTADKFPMFQSYPITFESYAPLAVSKIGERDFAILHAPSRMVFEFPAGARKLTGDFGIIEAAYTQGNHTNGARFVIYWSDGTNRSDLYQRLLNPAKVAPDRGIQDFSVSLSHLQGGRLYFEILPGPRNDFSYDWAGWSNIKITR